jgi:hypothetical protein
MIKKFIFNNHEITITVNNFSGYFFYLLQKFRHTKQECNLFKGNTNRFEALDNLKIELANSILDAVELEPNYTNIYCLNQIGLDFKNIYLDTSSKDYEIRNKWIDFYKKFDLLITNKFKPYLIFTCAPIRNFLGGILHYKGGGKTFTPGSLLHGQSVFLLAGQKSNSAVAVSNEIDNQSDLFS